MVCLFQRKARESHAPLLWNVSLLTLSVMEASVLVLLPHIYKEWPV